MAHRQGKEGSRGAEKVANKPHRPLPYQIAFVGNLYSITICDGIDTVFFLPGILLHGPQTRSQRVYELGSD